MNDTNDEIRGYFDAAGNPVVLTGSTAFVVEIQTLQKLLAKKDAEIERLKALLTRAADVLDNGDLAILDEMRKAAE